MDFFCKNPLLSGGPTPPQRPASPNTHAIRQTVTLMGHTAYLVIVAGFQHGLHSRLASSARSRHPHSAKSSYLSAAIFKFPLLPHSSPSNVAYLIGYPPLPYLVRSFDFSHIVMKNCMSPLVIDLGCQPSSRRIRQCIPSGCHA
jgi:hypothetical protein